MNFLGDKRSILQWIIFALAAVIVSCNPAEQKTIVQKAKTLAKPQLTQPFRFHKMIEVSPGNSFDVLSWGRGSTETGSFLILASDSAEAKYTTTTGDLDGAIIDVFNTDMDVDGNPEILIQAKSKDSTVHTRIYAFEYKDNKAQKLDFPKLNQSQRKGYGGEDNFYIKEGVLMREFPIFEGSGTDAKPTAEKRILEYGLRSNSFTVKTVSKDVEEKKQNSSADTTKNQLQLLRFLQQKIPRKRSITLKSAEIIQVKKHLVKEVVAIQAKSIGDTGGSCFVNKVSYV